MWRACFIVYLLYTTNKYHRPNTGKSWAKFMKAKNIINVKFTDCESCGKSFSQAGHLKNHILQRSQM